MEVKNKILGILVVLTLVMVVGIGSAAVIELEDPVTLGQNFTLAVDCSTCTFMNISSMQLPNGSNIIYNTDMTKTGVTFQYTILSSEIDSIGDYYVSVYHNKDGTYDDDTIKFKVSATGDNINDSQGTILIAQGILIALFFAMGRAFDKKKWKLKMGFDIVALLMAIVLTNSIKIMASQSAGLTSMGESMFIGAIAIFSLMIAYMLIMMTIEVVQYFKKKNRDRWEVDNNAY